MTKNEFVGLVASKTGVTKKDSEAVLNVTLEQIKELLAKGDSVAFVGFGTFSVATRAEREARVPSTGAVIKVPAKKSVKFKVGKTLKDAVAGA